MNNSPANLGAKLQEMMKISDDNENVKQADEQAPLVELLVMPNKVIIDGVLYIPAKEVLANRMEIAKGLLMGFWGECDDEKANEFINDPDIKVLVNDWGEGQTLSSVLDDITGEA